MIVLLYDSQRKCKIIHCHHHLSHDNACGETPLTFQRKCLHLPRAIATILYHLHGYYILPRVITGPDDIQWQAYFAKETVEKTALYFIPQESHSQVGLASVKANQS